MRLYKAVLQIIPVVLTASLFLCACKEEQIVYEVPSRKALTEAMSEEASPASGEKASLTDALGITEKRWKEELKTNKGSARIKVSILLPDASDMYVMKVKEHYADNTDKKKIVEKLFDAGQVKVNLDKTPSTQWADTVLSLMEEIKNEYPDYTGVSEYCEMEKKIITEGYADLPSRDSLSEDVGDYSANHYIGTKDGIVYTLDFFTDPDTNRSLWAYRARDKKDFHEGAMNIMSAFTDRYSVGLNDSAMSEEEAKAIVEKKIADLGFDYMKSNIVSTLSFVVQGGRQDDYNIAYDGYYVVLTRECEGTCVDGMIHYLNREDNPDGWALYDPESMVKAYDRERMCVEINEKGIMSIVCSGWMDEAEPPQIARLMPFSQIQEAIRDNLKETVTQNNMTFENMYLTYVKVMDSEDENVYRYIPAWRMNRYGWDLTRDTITQNYWFSAIDGSRIMTEQCGDVDVDNADDFLMELDLSE